MSKNNATSKPKPNDSKQPKEKKKQLPKCWHCEGYHYNRDCPTKQDKSPQWRGKFRLLLDVPQHRGSRAGLVA
uniref:Uncharacterized protein n=1 Tax=Trichogramma kaykai TaxID=54128 RepID=A0ABD2WVU5_9HYME